MALFSPAVQSLFPVESLPLALHYEGSSGDKPAFHYKGGLSALMAALRTECETNAPLRDYLATNVGRWAGCCNDETLQGMLDTAHNLTAFKAFEAEKSRIETAYTKSKLQLSPVGAAFSIARVIQGHPVACYRRPKTRLPVKVVECSISVSSEVQHGKVSASMARIVNAAHHYHVAGGPVKLTVHYLLAFNQKNPETGAQGLVVSLDIPVADSALAAFSASVQFFRIMAIGLAQALSGTRNDNLQCWKLDKRGLVGIHGMADDGAATLEALKVTS